MRKYNKKTTRFVKIATVILLVFSFVTSAFPMLSYADDSFDKLWAEKLAYEDKGQGNGPRYYTNWEFGYGPYFYGDFGGEGGDIWGYGFEFLPFTEQGKKLTYKYNQPDDIDFKGAQFSKFWELGYGTPIYTCLELEDFYSEISRLEGYRSTYRYVIQKLGITADELREAYRRMVEEPEYARQTLSALSDEEYDKYVNFLKNENVPDNFIIEAACMKDNEKGESLLAEVGFVYVKELGYCIDAWDFFFYHKYDVEDYPQFDLTTDSFSLFADVMKEYFDFCNGENIVGDLVYTNFLERRGEKDEKGRTPTQRFEAFYAEYERQLENPQTGEELIFVPLAIVSFICGMLIVIKKRRVYI